MYVKEGYGIVIIKMIDHEKINYMCSAMPYIAPLLPYISFAQTPDMFYDNLRNFFQNSRGQQHLINAAIGTEKLSFKFTSSYSTSGPIPNKKYEVLNFNYQTMIKASTKNSLHDYFRKAGGQ